MIAFFQGEIKATGFNEAVDSFYNLLEENKVYYISGAKVNMARKQFSTIQNDYELGFERNTEIIPVRPFRRRDCHAFHMLYS